MKKIFAGTPHTKFIAAASALTWTIAMANSAGAAQLQEARVTQVVNDVKLLLEQGAPRTAVVSDLVRRGNAVRTGTQSRSELTFADLTITRLGANTIFSFKEGTREMNLIDGAILFQVPKGSGGATIRTVGVTAAITGTTGIGEFHPATANRPQPISKWLCLEGTFHLYLANGQSLELGPGKMVTTDGKSFSKVVTFDIAKLVSTSLFFTGFDQPLASMNLIMLESENQIASLFAMSTTNPLDPARIVNVTSQAFAAEETPTSPAASPTPPVTPTPPVSPTPPPPTPSKFGTPSVISSPAPYLITNGTVITTDPSITTNGVTDYGKIYRGQARDGAFSLWAFGSTSAFDTALRIDNTFFADPSHLPIAVFKFESLSLTGDPTIDTSNGATKLALIGMDGITSRQPGGTLTFTGLDLLLLATVNGSINLTSDVSFQDLHELVMYARGAGSDLTINSPISNIGILGLVAEDSLHLTNPGTMSVGKLDAITGGDLMLQIGGSLLLNGRVRLDAIVLPGAGVASGVNLTLNVAGDYRNNSATESSRLAITNRDHVGTGGNIAVSIGGDLTTTGTAGDFALVVQNATGQIDNGGNITLNVDGSVSTQGQLSLLVENYHGANPGGHIGTGGNISLATGGDLTAGSIDAFINDRDGGTIDSGGNINFNIGGALTTQGDAQFSISDRYLETTGGTIASDVTLTMNAASISIGGTLGTAISSRSGGHIGGSVLSNVSVTGDLVAQVASFSIVNNDFSNVGSGGTIASNATVAVNAANISVGGNLVFFITNSSYFDGGIGGGMIGENAVIDVSAVDISSSTLFTEIQNIAGNIGGNAIIDFGFSDDINTQGNADFTINNSNGTGPNGGTIGSNATINVTAQNVTADALFASIINFGGNISGNAVINVGASGDINAPGGASFQIINDQNADGNGPGTIGSDAIIGVSAGNLTAGSLLVQIDNKDGGVIGSNATIDFSSGSAAVTNDATFQILGSDGAASAAINFNGGSYDTGGMFLAFIDGNGTITFNNASAHADVLKAGVFGANGVLNIGGGTLSADTTLKLYAPGSNGQLNFISNVTLGGNSAKILAANSVTIFDNVVVTIGGKNPADVYTGFKGEIPNANYTGFGGNGSTTGTFGGAGANDPQPIEKAPPFDNTNRVTSSGKPRGGGKATDTTINVSNSDELLALLNDVHPGRDGKITIPASKRANNSKNSSRVDPAGRLNSVSRSNVNLRAKVMRTASSSVVRHSPQ